MPRQPREKSPTNIYHVMVRGVGKMTLFPKVADKTKYLSLLQDYKKLLEINLYAYCLMDNHVHLLLKEEKEDDLANLMHRTGICFSQYFNRKYNRVGHVFQNRYRSDVIGDEEYFIQCACYIHNNPVKAGLVGVPAHYRWSSYNLYMTEGADELVDKDLLLSYHSANLREATDSLKQYTKDNLSSDFTFAEVEDETDRLSAAKKIIEVILAENKVEISGLRCMPVAQRTRILRSIKEKVVASNREIAKLLNLSKDMVHRA